MSSARTQAAAPVVGAASRRPAGHEQERELEITLLGFDGWPALAVYSTEWEADEENPGRSFRRPTVTLLDVCSTSTGVSIRNAAGRAQCAAITRRLEEDEADVGPPEPRRPYHHYE